MKKGFTLIEIIVALMIFSIVVVVALAALVKILDANKKAQTIQDAVVSMSFTMESMTRELRTGSAYYCKKWLGDSDLNLPPSNSLSSQDIGDCNGVSSSVNNQAVGFAFLTNKTATNAGGCRLINAYEIVPNLPGGSFNGTFSFKKASQTACNQSLTFTPVLDTNSLSLTGYFLQAKNSQFPLLFVRMDGNAGNREAVKTYFSIQTASSARIP